MLDDCLMHPKEPDPTPPSPQEQLRRMLVCTCGACLRFQAKVKAGEIVLPRPLAAYGVKRES